MLITVNEIRNSGGYTKYKCSTLNTNADIWVNNETGKARLMNLTLAFTMDKYRIEDELIIKPILASKVGDKFLVETCKRFEKEVCDKIFHQKLSDNITRAHIELNQASFAIKYGKERLQSLLNSMTQRIITRCDRKGTKEATERLMTIKHSTRAEREIMHLASQGLKHLQAA